MSPYESVEAFISDNPVTAAAVVDLPQPLTGTFVTNAEAALLGWPEGTLLLTDADGERWAACEDDGDEPQLFVLADRDFGLKR